MTMDKNQVLEIIREKIFANIIDPDVYDFSINDIKNDDILFGNENFAIDSVDFLEALVNMQKQFNIKIDKVDATFFSTHMKTFNDMANFIINSMSK
jgi:acyl carrier protein